ncbi:TerB family tellurite resistance protein [Pararhodobacter oceanensis]|uniref:tellurite resistance TerB family protein n=1 Tax=Pararhodobacter oceanensis TaxID=2172121 RepID=UPI003A9364BB
MIDALKSLFRPQATARAEVPQDVAVAALLIEAARADGVYDAAEKQAVKRLLRDMFDLGDAQVDALHDQAAEAQQGAADMVRFTRVVKMALEEHERIAIIEALWRVVLVDHIRDPHENALMRHLAPLIAVSDYDSAAARRRVLAESGESDS